MESRFGYNFSNVRIHSDASAAEQARTIGARAFTSGQDIVFDRVITALTLIDATRMLGQDDDGGLWQVEPNDGTSFGWALNVTQVVRSPRRGYVAYLCDRGGWQNLWLACAGIPTRHWPSDSASAPERKRRRWLP